MNLGMRECMKTRIPPAMHPHLVQHSLRVSRLRWAGARAVTWLPAALGARFVAAHLNTLTLPYAAALSCAGFVGLETHRITCSFSKLAEEEGVAAALLEHQAPGNGRGNQGARVG